MCYYKIFCQNNLNLSATNVSALSLQSHICTKHTAFFFIYVICFHAFTKYLSLLFVSQQNLPFIFVVQPWIHFAQYENKKFFLYEIWSENLICHCDNVCYICVILCRFVFVLRSLGNGSFFFWKRLNFRKTTDKQCKTMDGIHLIKTDIFFHCLLYNKVIKCMSLEYVQY